jgi:branched-chain amino acid transport system substrate-binding protein
MISALEGWTFDAPKGTTTIRAGDHAMLQPMFTARLIAGGTEPAAEVVDTLEPEDTAPPETAGE